jgi:hypothetical protein
MIAQIILSVLLVSVLFYAWAEYRRSPVVASLSLIIATAGLYFVWLPEASSQLADFVGIGRGADLILYTWACLSLLVVLNLHLKLRTQLELITVLTRSVALASAEPALMRDQNESAPAMGRLQKDDVRSLPVIAAPSASS